MSLRWERWPMVMGALVVSAGLAACGGDHDDDAAARLSSSDQVSGAALAAEADADEVAELTEVVPVSGDPAEVTARDNEFDIENIQVAAGTTVVWANQGQQDHNILPSGDGDGDWGVQVDGFQPDATYEHTFESPGTYRYYCSLHGTETAGMTGAVVVE